MVSIQFGKYSKKSGIFVTKIFKVSYFFVIALVPKVFSWRKTSIPSSLHFSFKVGGKRAMRAFPRGDSRLYFW